MNLSLDDIIRKNNFKKSNQTSRGRVQSSLNGKRNSGGSLNRVSQSNGKVTRTPRHPPQNKDKPRVSFANKKSGGVVDARLKIIQKNRQRLTDARDKLSELAKQTDARTKIKGRRQKVAQLPERRQGRGQGPRNNFNTIAPRPLLLQRSIRNNVTGMRDANSLIRCTINRTDMWPYEEDMEMDSLQPMRPHNDLSSIKVVTQNEYTHYNRQEYLPQVQEPMYVEHHYDQPPMFTRQLQPPRELMVGRSGGRMSQEMRARLDTPARPPPLYSYPSAPLSPPPSQGHRIVVSNLHSSVTHEDIKELFEDIGPLVTSRLVRAGTAEVIYKLQKDAKKAVEAYHNRQLDGQPMKCLLVNPRSPPGSSGVLRSNNMPAPPKFPGSSKSMVVPDLSAIHKALFTSK